MQAVLEVEVEGGQRVADVYGGGGDGREWQADVCPAQLALDPVRVREDVTLGQGQTGVVPEVGEAPAVQVDCTDVPVGAFEDRPGQVTADEACGAEDEEVHRAGPS